MSGQYILNAAGEPEPCDDVLEWGRWFQNATNRIVQQDRIGEAMVSTVFLGLDHSFRPGAIPTLFETMIFWRGHQLDGWQDRYATRTGALDGHAEAVKLVKAADN